MNSATCSSEVHPADAREAARVLSGLGGVLSHDDIRGTRPRRRSGPASASTLRSDDWGVSGLSQHQNVEGRSSGSPRRTSTSKLRTMSQIYQHTGGAPPNLPEGFPVGPYCTISMHMDRIKTYAKDPSQGGGIFFIREKETKRPGQRRGPIARVVCNREGHKPSQAGVVKGVTKQTRRRGSIRCGCKWSVTLELIDGPEGVAQ